MRYPMLNELNTSRDMVDAFGGYNHNLRIGNGEFYDMTNMSSDSYPVLTPRAERGVYARVNAGALIEKDALCYVSGTKFYINEYGVDMGLSSGEKQLISMGAYVIVMPDRKWINTATHKCGNIDSSISINSDVTFSLCTVDGAEYNATPSDDAPENPQNLDYWIDTSSIPHTLKQYSESAGMWVTVATTYVKIKSETISIGEGFEQYDGVTISGIVKDGAKDLNGSAVIWAKGDKYIVVVGLLESVVTQSVSEGKITVSRKMPLMDFIIESENRLWGCKYGVNADGQVVNEIYASKLGDFKNWNCFMGLSTDSYAVSLGSDGMFTGAITHLGYPLFFKENCVHKIYGNFPSNYQVQTTALRGVQRGSEKSLAIVNEILYYKARHAVCAFDGSLPVEVSSALGEERYGGAVGVAHGNKYYVSMQSTSDNKYHLFVYDTSKGMWHKEDNLRADDFCSVDGNLYCIENGSGNILVIAGNTGGGEGVVPWAVETGDLYLSSPDMKYITKLTVRMALDVGSEVSFFVQYDMDGVWVDLGKTKGTNLRSFPIPIRPLRCDHLKLRLEGKGGAKIYSITKTMEQGSDVS